MFYLNKLGNLLDDIDTGKDVAGDSDSPADAPVVCQPSAGSSEAESSSSDLFGRSLGLLSSAAAAAGSAAAKASEVAAAAADGAAKGSFSTLGVSTISSLLGDDGEDEDEPGPVAVHGDPPPEEPHEDRSAAQGGREATFGGASSSTSASTFPGAGPDPPVGANGTERPPQDSPATSSRDFVAEGWSLEERPPDVEHAVERTSSFTPSESVARDWEAAEVQLHPHRSAPEEEDATEVHSGSVSGASSSLFANGNPHGPEDERPAAEEAPESLLHRPAPEVEFNAPLPSELVVEMPVEAVASGDDVNQIEEQLVAAAQQIERLQEQLVAAVQQIERLQGRIYELEGELAQRSSRNAEADRRAQEAEQQLRLQAERVATAEARLAEVQASESALRQEAARRAQEVEQQLRSHVDRVAAAEARIAEVQASEAQLQRQVQQLRQEAAEARRLAQDQADQEKEHRIGEVRAEMEEELRHMLSQKDEQVRSLDSKLASSEKARKDLAREVDDLHQEVDELKAQVGSLQNTGAGQISEHKKELETLTAQHKQKVEELESQRATEERQKHELTLNLRSMEERSRAEISQLEAQRSQLEIQLGALQVQLQSEQQKGAELCVAVGEAQQRVNRLELERSSRQDEAQQMVKDNVAELKAKLQFAEEKLLEAQRDRDKLASEVASFRSDLQAQREEKAKIQDEYLKAQDRLRDISAPAQVAAGQQSVMDSVQKEFDGRVQSLKEEVSFLRHKCEEKELRLQQLTAEKNSLAAELRSAGGSSSWKPSELTAAEASADSPADVEAGRVGGAKAPAAKSTIRSLSLTYPEWLRSADEPLRFVIRAMATYPEARLPFFAYFIVLHAWVLFVLQHMAMQHK